jgi:hypothetical protein
VVDRFLRIRKEYFLEINLKQFLIIANQLIAEPDKASEALLKLCNQLSHHSTHSQVTHLASIHQSASETALRLARRYQDVEIDNYELFSFLKQEITKLPQTHETQAAIRCLDKMLAPQYKHKVDKDSNVSLQELLAYCILAIQDTSEVLAELPVCVSALTQGLYEIQRGYNKSEEQQVDQAICDGGTFNKLIEVLVGIHPDFQQVVMNLGMASAKFIRIVIHHIQKYILELPSPTTIEEKEQFRALIQNLKLEGPGGIWEDIVEGISKELFEEFSQVFESPDNVSFTTILSCGRDTDVIELDAFFDTMMAKKVYHYDSRFFSRRIEDANIQHEFDKNYGLIIYHPS